MTELKQFKIFYRAIRDVSKVVHSKTGTDLNEVLKLMVSNTTQGLNGKGAALCIFNKETASFTIRASYGIDEKYLALEPLAGKRFFSWPNKEYTPHIITDISNAPRVKYPKEAWDIGIRMMLDVPLMFDNLLFGFLRTYFEEKKVFSDDELDFMNAVTEQCACAINHDSKIKFHILQYNKLATKIDRLSSLGRMAAGIAHEINNPLTGILLYSSNLFKKASPDGPFKEGLEIIMQETQRCKVTIQGLLDFSREKKPEKVDANLNTVIEKSLALMDNEFLIKRIQIIKNLDPAIVNFQLDPNQIEQVLINLLLNAVHAIDGKGTIGIRSRMDTENNTVLIEIQDNGYGIPQDKLQKIFEPFYTTKSDGTGLGLSVSYGIIRNHQGTVNVLSEPGIGTLIRIELPIMDDTNEDNTKG
ncbi:ATP-binding protein [Desulfobacula sp.]|uniref:GAF domain-containing sensor histidine kinase n=1 Tax=Desulfobacula sp. TaxID=2593537 RepID=UPI0026122559|nr:ATP-binding protein [Desulfobacula sp.]